MTVTILEVWLIGVVLVGVLGLVVTSLDVYAGYTMEDELPHRMLEIVGIAVLWPFMALSYFGPLGDSLGLWICKLPWRIVHALVGLVVRRTLA